MVASMGVSHPCIRNHWGRSADACCEVTVFERAGAVYCLQRPLRVLCRILGGLWGPGPDAVLEPSFFVYKLVKEDVAPAQATGRVCECCTTAVHQCLSALQTLKYQCSSHGRRQCECDQFSK